jgi:hypothetical protein
MIKVERGLIEGLVESAFLRTLTTSVLRLGQELGLTTVAEGVDHAAQAVLLRELGCHRGQGRFFSGPLPEEQLDAVLCGPGFSVPEDAAAGTAGAESPRLVHPSGESGSDLRLHRPGHPRTNSDQQGRSRGSRLGLGPHDETSIPPA